MDKRKTISLKVTQEIHKKLKQLAESEKRTLQNFLNLELEKIVNRNGKKEKVNTK